MGIPTSPRAFPPRQESHRPDLPIHPEGSCRKSAAGYTAFSMTLQTLREMRDTTPFRPFEIRLARGRSFPVVSTDHLFLMPGRSDFVLVLPDGGFRIVDASQVESVDRNDQQPSDKGPDSGTGER